MLRYRLWGRLPRVARRWLVRVGAPTFTVGALCVVVDDDDGSVLLVRLAYRRAWGLPGGLLDRGEQPAATAVREAHEETGLAIALVGEPTVQVEPRLRRIDVVFRCRAVGGELGAVRSGEVLEARWWPLAGLPALHPEAASALRLVGLSGSRA